MTETQGNGVAESSFFVCGWISEAHRGYIESAEVYLGMESSYVSRTILFTLTTHHSSLITAQSCLSRGQPTWTPLLSCIESLHRSLLVSFQEKAHALNAYLCLPRSIASL